MKRILFLVSVVLIGLFVVGFRVKDPVLQSAPQPTQSTVQNLNSDRLFQLVNEWRTQNGYQVYEMDERLCEIASIRLKEIQVDWSHNKFSAKRFCNFSCTLGENLIRDTFPEDLALESWLGSLEHRKNLQDDFKYSCIKTDRLFAVQIFANF